MGGFDHGGTTFLIGVQYMKGRNASCRSKPAEGKECTQKRSRP